MRKSRAALATPEPASRQPAFLPACPPSPDPFGAPPLIAGEDGAAYGEFLARVTAAVAPADFFEEMWARDVVDLAWEVFRLRRLKAELVSCAADEGLERLLARTLQWDVAQELARRWAAREPRAIKAADRHLARAGLTMESVRARTLAARIEEVERIDRMIASAEGRRSHVMREVERHRAGFAQALRREGEIEDAAFEEVPPAPAGEAPRWDLPAAPAPAPALCR